jgi:hypothetical protein
MFKGILFDNVISLEKRPYASFGSHALDVALSVVLYLYIVLRKGECKREPSS